MLSHFHERHPMGSIITDLLQVEEGIFIVKAQVIVNNTVLGTGLAGSTTIEEAEDAALQRALDHAGFTKANLKAFASQAPTPMSSAPMSNAPMSNAPVYPSPARPAPGNGHQDGSWSLPEHRPAPAPDPSGSATYSEMTGSSDTGVDTDDLSDIIAQSDVELQRIGWSAQEGREFLKSRFNKKSRHQLSPGELREFLGFLKQQPTRSRHESPF